MIYFNLIKKEAFKNVINVKPVHTAELPDMSRSIAQSPLARQEQLPRYSGLLRIGTLVNALIDQDSVGIRTVRHL